MEILQSFPGHGSLMFERYDEPARRALFFARYEASLLGSMSIETEHLLLGLIREPRGLAARVLGALPLLTVRKPLEAQVRSREKVPTSVEIPFSEDTKRVLAAQSREPRAQGREPRAQGRESRAENPEPTAPIGVFDSGVGGLSVLREIRRELPSEDLIYVADSGYAPYGDRTAEYVQERAIAMAEFLIARGAKAIVVACNTATGIAVDALRARFDLPIVAIEPAVKPAVAETRSGVVGVIATSQTLAGEKYSRLVKTHAGDVQVLSQPCPGLVEQVEAGDLSGPATRALVDRFVRPLVEQGADTIVLGCTHYPFLIAAIRDAAGRGVTMIDPAVPVARELRRRLRALDLLAPDGRRATEQFWTTGPVDQVRAVMTQLWASDVDLRGVPSSRARRSETAAR